MHNAHDPKVLPIRDGVSPSCVVLPSQGGGLLIDFLAERLPAVADRKSTRLNSSHLVISYAVFCLKKKKLCTASNRPPSSPETCVRPAVTLWHHGPTSEDHLSLAATCSPAIYRDSSPVCCPCSVHV